MAPKGFKDNVGQMSSHGSCQDSPISELYSSSNENRLLRSRNGNSPGNAAAADEVNGHDYGQDDYQKSRQKKDWVRYHGKVLRSVFSTEHKMPVFHAILISVRELLRRRLLVLFLIITVYAVYKRRTIESRYLRLFGLNPFDGGMYGRQVDQAILQHVIDTGYRERKEQLERMGVDLPDVRHVRSYEVLNMDTNAALRELLIRRETRARVLQELENTAGVHQIGCQTPTSDSLLPSFFDSSQPTYVLKGIPRALFVPDIMSWQQPRPNTVGSFQWVTFTETEMRDLIRHSNLDLLETYNSLSSLKDRIDFWSIVTVYLHGGVFLGNRTSVTLDEFRDVLGTSFPVLSDNPDHQLSACTSPVSVAIFEETENASGEGSDYDIALLAVTPRHPHLRCVIDRLSNRKEQSASSILKDFFLSSSVPTDGESSLSSDPTWHRLSTSCTYKYKSKSKCCKSAEVTPVKTLPPTSGNFSKSESQSQIYIQVKRTTKEQRESPRFAVVNNVTIQEVEGTEKPSLRPKVTLEERMYQNWASPGWLCSRCLKAPIFGSFDKCTLVCPSAFENLLCNTPDVQNQDVDVEVTINTEMQTFDRTTKRIPRIIHQTWFEDLSVDRYPHLVRLQNSWANSGWEYRFYTDEDARKYIVENFPKRFVDAFDALIPGAYKADLFRYLVLLKDGGIYTDVDIMLETNLDSFVSPHLSFFAARDIVGEHANEPFCLWNGLIGSAPGHPFLIRAVERLVNLILRRADMYDMESDVCQRDGHTMETWKVRAEPLLLLSGPCALGVAVNDVLNRSSLSKFEIGWLPTVDEEVDYGDAIVLVGDKYDLGSFRISDPERNLILAATDMKGLDKQPREIKHLTKVELQRRKVRRKAKPHYSSTGGGSNVWGQNNVYKDKMVNNEEIKLDLVVKDHR